MNYPHQPLDSTPADHDIQLQLLPEASRSAPDLSSPKLTPPTTTTTNQPIQTIQTTHQTTTHSFINTNTHQRSQSHFNVPSTTHPPNHSIQFEKRFQALLEIIETENGYLRDLKRLDEFYLSKIDMATNLKLHQKQIIRRNIAQVIELAERFSRRISIAIGTPAPLPIQNSLQLPNSTRNHLPLEQDSRTHLIIRDQVELDRIIERLAKAFISESPIFTIYEEFCAKHTEAADLIRSFESTPEWHSLLHQSNHYSPSSDAFNLNPSNSINPPPSPATITNFSSQNNSNHTSLPSIRLSLQDYIIKPIQRIMRYPMLLNGLLKQMNDHHSPDSNRARERVQQALWAMKQVAEGVDEAKSLREIELKTELIASRMELHSSYRAAFVCLLGQIKLVGSLHILYHGPSLDPSEAFKIKYYGIFLYQTHMVVVKVKRATVYEPRHWFPIRYFDLVDINDCSGLMPYSFSLKYRQHTFEFGATCEPEKRVWMNKLRELKAEIDHLRSIQIMSAIPISDDSIVSSINLTENSHLPMEGPPRNGSPIEEDPTSDEPTPTTPAAATQSRVSQRLSRNVNTLLGRTAEVAQAAIDLKLTEVFSDVLLCARLQDGGVESGGRTRTLSTTGSTSAKRNSQAVMTTRFGVSNTLSSGGVDRKLKRMSYMEPNMRSREMVPPLPRMFNSSPETTSSMSTRSSLRRARSGPSLVSSRSSSSIHPSDRDDASSQTHQPPTHHRARSRNHSAANPTTTSHLVSEPSNYHHYDSPTTMQERSLSPEIEDEPAISPTTVPDEQTMSKPPTNNNHSNSPFSSSNLWFPGLKMVRRLSRVGAKNKKDQNQSVTSSVGDHAPIDPKESNNRSTPHPSQPSNSNNNKSKEQNEAPPKKLMGRMNRQASAPNPSHFPASSSTTTTTHSTTPGTTNSSSSSNGNTFKRVFMKRNRSSGSNCPHPHHHLHQHPLHLQRQDPSSSSSSDPNATIREKENHHDASPLEEQHFINSSSIPTTNNFGSNNNSSSSSSHHASHVKSTTYATPSPSSSSHNLGSSSSSSSLGGGGNPFGSMLRSIMRMTPLSDSSSSSSSTTTTTPPTTTTTTVAASPITPSHPHINHVPRSSLLHPPLNNLLDDHPTTTTTTSFNSSSLSPHSNSTF